MVPVISDRSVCSTGQRQRKRLASEGDDESERCKLSKVDLHNRDGTEPRCLKQIPINLEY